jgi:hypothetical protein
MYNLSIRSWDLSGLRERKKWMVGGCWCLYNVQKHLAGPVIGAWIGGSKASVCLPACVRGMGDGSVCTYPTSCTPASIAEEFRQVLQVIQPGVIHDTLTMFVRIPVAIVLVDGALRRSRPRGVVSGASLLPLLLLLMLLLFVIAYLRWPSHYEAYEASAVCNQPFALYLLACCGSPSRRWHERTATSRSHKK